ncbi:MAG: hypothetical protein ACRCU2_27050 [Planktothrix sp.]
MTVFELALFIAILVAVILLVATILNNASDFHARTPWFEITISIKSRIRQFNDWLPSPLSPPRFRLSNHSNLISFKYHLIINSIGVFLGFGIGILTILIGKEFKLTPVLIINNLPVYWRLLLLLSIPNILLLIKKLEVSWARALAIVCIALFVYLYIDDTLDSITLYFINQIFLLSLGSWINYKLEWD